MRHSRTHLSRQKGVVLVIGLLLLLVITIVAVASMGGANMQERMAGNARTQAIAFEVASAGASNSLAFYQTHLAAVPSTACTTPANWAANAHTITTSPPNIGAHQVRLTQQLYCLQAPIRPEYFVLSTGEVLAAGSTLTIARRAIETHVVRPPEADCGALCFPGCDEADTYSFPNSNAFKVDGNGNPAITTPEACRARVRTAISQNRIRNYDGGISGFSEPLPHPWTSPNSLNNFRIELLETMGAGYDAADPFRVDQTSPSASGTVQGSTYTWQFIQPPTSGTFLETGNTVYGTRANPQITYIAGNADMRGTVSGAGILIVEGTLDWAGTPPFQALIVVLGGRFSVGGGGTGGNFAGSLVVSNLWNNYPTHYYTKPDPATYLRTAFGPTVIDFTGGGTATYRYDCEFLAKMAGDLTLAPWSPVCGTGEGGGAQSERIASWRENIGWRVDFID